MTAKAEGKINAATVAADVQAGRTVRVLVTDQEWGKHATPEFLAGGTPERLVPSNVKTKVVAATVHSTSALMTSGGRRSSRQYTLHTDKGDLTGLAPIQTMWLAPDDTPEPAPAADAAPVPAGNPAELGHRTPNSLREGDAVYLTPDLRPAGKDATGALVGVFRGARKRTDGLGRFDVGTSLGTVRDVHGSQRFRLAPVPEPVSEPEPDEGSGTGAHLSMSLAQLRQELASTLAERDEIPAGCRRPSEGARHFADAYAEKLRRRIAEIEAAEPEPEAEPEPVIARRATTREAKRHFEAGGTVLVSERGGKPTTIVNRLTTTHDRTRITWEELAATVDEWKNRYPNQRYYIVPDLPGSEETDPRIVKLAARFAAKFIAETSRAEPPVHAEPTDEDFAERFKHCARPPDADLYPLIREQIARMLEDTPDDLVGQSLTRRDGTVGQVAAVERFTAALGGDECTDIAYTDGERERYLVREVPAPVVAPRPVYAVGDRVSVRNNGEMTVGIVVGVNEYPDDDMPVIYDVHVIPTGVIPATGEELASAPMPEPGQRWISFGRFGPSVVTVIGPTADASYPAGLVHDTDVVRGVMLAAAHWRLLDESNPHDLAHARQSALKRQPAVGKILTRVARMGDTDRTALIDAGLRHRSVYRKDQTNLTERAARAYGEHWRDLFAVWDQVANSVSLDGSQPSAGHVVADAVFGELVREHLNDNEYRIFAGPWLDVIGVRA